MTKSRNGAVKKRPERAESGEAEFARERTLRVERGDTVMDYQIAPAKTGALAFMGI